MARTLVYSRLPQPPPRSAAPPLRRSAAPLAHLVNLICLARAGKQRPEGEQLRHDAPAGEGVDGRVVVLAAEQNFGGAVPPRAHVVGIGRPGADLPSQTVIGNLHRVPLGEHVLGLNVAVEEAVLVHEGKALEDLVHYIANLGLGEVALSPLHDFVQIGLHELKHKEQLVVFSNHLLQLDYIRVVELLQRFHFAQLHALLPSEELACKR